MIGKIILVAIAIPSILLVGGGIYNWLVSLEYQREVGQYFTYADRASDAPTKSQYFDQYIKAIEDNDLTEGSSSVFFQDQPNSKLADHYVIAKSLQARLHNITTMNPTSFEYQTALQQITLQEFCWFPVNPFYQGYLLRHGAWGAALTPDGVVDRCAPNT